MTIGTRDDIATRLAQLVPNGWFKNGLSPLRDALLRGIASALSFSYSLLIYIQLQTRLATASDGWLDMIAGDFFGGNLSRTLGQSDDSLRAQIIINMFRERGTRRALSMLLSQLTGRAPIIFEPARPADTGGYGIALGYGLAGGYGSLLLPGQTFVTVFQGSANGVPGVSGYGIVTGAYRTPSRSEYAPLAAAQGAGASDLFAAVNAVRPVTYTIWVRFSA